MITLTPETAGASVSGRVRSASTTSAPSRDGALARLRTMARIGPWRASTRRRRTWDPTNPLVPVTRIIASRLNHQGVGTPGLRDAVVRARYSTVDVRSWG